MPFYWGHLDSHLTVEPDLFFCYSGWVKICCCNNYPAPVSFQGVTHHASRPMSPQCSVKQHHVSDSKQRGLWVSCTQDHKHDWQWSHWKTFTVGLTCCCGSMDLPRGHWCCITELTVHNKRELKYTHYIDHFLKMWQSLAFMVGNWNTVLLELYFCTLTCL